ncbi:dihydrolipoyl dehydrogenase family protein [Chelativorans salis]|uniref:NAD(P)/FAD-dependent oxidoreductase n=1 Tax=Chelativorans salis TaxID=2978478 RepID=A0ABT2LJA6_9HYPH|nr:NAD(P)/FAD-dependent oxidoreductase [Chelativorans sp. EGI FJ00035]MCT7374666.1 NAD(P)/FAD-dependent oxidoreductase [Chelativorans sp. EGI FJ00035]
MSNQFDLIVIGTGTAARVAATRIRAAGWSVAIVDYRPFGGTCALRGCDPKKILVGAASAIDHTRRMQDHGVAGVAHLNWPELNAFKRSFTDPVPAKQEKSYAEKGIHAFHGHARFTGPNSLNVEGNSLEARRALIAAGAEPVRLGIPGEEHLITSEQFLALKSLPERIVMVGGGYIAAEFSHIAALAGAQVTILQRGERLLKHFEPELVDWLMEKFRALGIDTQTKTSVEAVDKTSTGYRVTAASAAGEVTIEADLVVHAAGRVPNLGSLDLDRAGTSVKDGRLQLNDYLQSVSNPAVYAAGDAAQLGPPLTPVSSHDAEVVARNLLDGNRHKPDYRGVPSVAFTIPPIAAVGLSEEEASRKGLKFRKNIGKASDWFTARQTAESVYGFKMIVEEGSGRILGAHLVGPHVDEVINLFALAIRNNLTASALKQTIFAYPTGASDIGHML